MASLTSLKHHYHSEDFSAASFPENLMTKQTKSLDQLGELQLKTQIDDFWKKLEIMPKKMKLL